MGGIVVKSGSRTVVLALAAALLAVPLGGCDIAQIRVRLPAFASGNVDGIWLWRLASGGYQRICRYDLSNAYFSGGREVVDYRETCLDGRNATPLWQATVERLPGDPQTVTLALVHRRGATTTGSPHRASAFNASGESALSTGWLAL